MGLKINQGKEGYINMHTHVIGYAKRACLEQKTLFELSVPD